MEEALKLINKLLEIFPRAYRWLFQYNIDCKYVQQGETNKGYIIEVAVRTRSNGVIQIRRDDICLRLTLDKQLVTDQIKPKIMYGLKTQVFDSLPVLQAHIQGLSYGNVSNYISVLDRPMTLWLLVTVCGPGSSNPSSRLQLGQVYVSLSLRIRKWLFWKQYLNVPLRHIAIVAGNEKTKIIDG